MRRTTRTMTIGAAIVLLAGCATPGGGASTSASASADGGGDAVTVATGETDAGTSLVGADGMTLYIFTSDTGGTSTCYEDCAAAWPPFEVEAGATPEAGDGVTGELGTTERDDGTTQVTYDGMPLYYYASDTEAGDATGEGVGDVWFIASPEGAGSPEPSGSDDGAAPTPYEY